MLAPMAIVVVISVICILAGLFGPDLVVKARRRRPVRVETRPVVAGSEPGTLEGVLVAELISGEITATQYRRLVEGLAVRDDDRNPLSVPPDLGSADA
ncbi:hypothetical protein JIG36_12150 [Actinoplanes sp. LDG1-06]|uniref:SHOCT domain-containing protein n=1 Tax=Paractinoplanes ovalisporus TaxID=2810368 RepID=A0ABS2A8Z0_9ACTN|nr:hypothetical protein [Actinoplanes ovalisporus]MBM2616308.1 hypothetical protein [Actinoplanes ovalisporus]